MGGIRIRLPEKPVKFLDRVRMGIHRQDLHTVRNKPISIGLSDTSIFMVSDTRKEAYITSSTRPWASLQGSHSLPDNASTSLNRSLPNASLLFVADLLSLIIDH